MNKKLTRTLAGVMSLMFVGQIMIFGDGASQGILHADTIASAAEAIEGAKNAEQLAAEFEMASEDLGEVEYFESSESNDANIMAMSENDTGLDEPSYAETLAITSLVQKGTVDDFDISDNTPIYVRIFDGNWNEMGSWEVAENQEFTVAASDYSDVYHVKFECDGYLPFYLKDFGTGTYRVGTGGSTNTITLIPGDTTWNEENSNQWSDDVLNSSDAAYVSDCYGETRGADNFNFSLDMDGNGTIDENEKQSVINYIGDGEEIVSTDIQIYDLDGNGLINMADYYQLYNWLGWSHGDTGTLDVNQNGIVDDDDLVSFQNVMYNSVDVWWYNLDMNNDGLVNADDVEYIDAAMQLQGASENYLPYMDKDNSGTIDDFDIAWFIEAYAQSGDLDWDHAFKRSLTVLENGYFPYSLNLHDTDLDLGGCALYVGDCMSFTTDMPQFWPDGQGATLDINGGALLIENNLVFRTASPDGWGGSAGQLMDIKGGLVIIGGDFNFGQANCYDTMLMTVPGGEVDIYGNWNYITLTDMEGKWTAGTIYFEGSTWEVNEASGEKSVYSTGDHVISLYYPEGVQTILWDNRYTYIYDEDGNPTTQRHLNFDYYDEEYDMCGLYFPLGYSPDRYHIRPWFPEDDTPYEPDYTLYRKGWEIGDGVHIATGNYTRSFTDLSIESPGVQSDFVRTYNSISTEEGSFGIGWDFNIDVSKIVIPAEGYYQVVLPDGSNTTFKEDGNGGFECLNAHSTMIKSGDEYTITNAAQSQYHFNADGELDWVKDAEGNILTISSMSNNQRIVTDSTGRTYTITYNGNSEHSRIVKIEDTTADRTITYAYNDDFQLISATSVSGGTESYAYDENGKLCKITNCYDEVTDQISYLKHGQVDWLTNASGLKQIYTYNKLQKQTGLKEYDGETLVKTYTYNYDEKYAVKTNTVEADGQTYEVDKITYNMINGENKYDEMSENADIMGNTTKYDRDANGNVIKTTNPDGTVAYARYNQQSSVILEIDESGYATIRTYDNNGTRLLKEASSLQPLSAADISTITNQDIDFNPVTYLTANESSYAITSHEYYADSYVSGIAGLIRATTDPEGNVTEYDYYKDGVGKGLVKSKTLKDDNTTVSTVTYEYNAQLQVSKETTSYDLSKNLYSVKEYEYDSFNNVTVIRDYGTGSTPATTITEYDLLSRKTAEYTPNYSANKSHGTRITYYPDDSVKTQTDAEGNVTSYVYDAYGNVIKQIDPDGTISLTEYDGLQREKAKYFMADAESAKQIQSTTSYEFVKNYSADVYTGLDSASSKSSSMLKTVNTTYVTADKQTVSEVLTNFRENTVYEKTNGETKKTNAYYENGEIAREIDALGNVTKYENAVIETDNGVCKVSRTYTPFNTKADGSVNYSITESQYDKNGNVILTKQTVQNENSNTAKYSVTENQYNAQGLLTQVTLSDGTSSGEKNITKYLYNNAGVQTAMLTGLHAESDSDYMTTNYEYDAWGRLVRAIDSTGYNSGVTTYDLNGNALSVTDANGNVTTNTYDALNRILTANTVHSTDSAKNISKSYEYDEMGRVQNVYVNDDHTLYLYDDLGRKIAEESSNGFKGYYYEGISQHVSSYFIGRNHQIVYENISYVYDDEMRVIQVKESGNLTASYTYDANGNKASETLANGVVSTYTYNGCNKITKLVTKSGNSTISEYEYSYYLDGSDACKTRTESGIIETTSYAYDGLKRLTEESVSNGTTADTYAYEYDDYGNRSKMVATGSETYETVYDYANADGNYTALLQKEIKTIKDTSDQTTANGLASSPLDLANAVSENSGVETTVYTYDANGNQINKVTDEKTETNTYDSLNQLIGFTDGETTASYKYDADGLRVNKTVNGQSIDQIWNDDKQIAVDADGSNPYKAQVYIRGTNLLAGCEFVQAVKSDYTYYTQNAHGDVVNLTDSEGAVTKTYRYDAFGVEKNIDDADANAFRYCGEYYDKETATIYLRARYYNPSNGRFISRDSVAGENTDPLSLNLYTYCCNNPIVAVDPNGHFAILAAIAIGAAVGAVISGGISLYKEASAVGGISNMTSENWKNVGVSAGIGAVGGAAGAFAGAAVGAALTASAASTLVASSITSTLSYSVATGMAGGMAAGYASTAVQQSIYDYSDPNELLENTIWGGVSGGIGSAIGYGLSQISTRSYTYTRSSINLPEYDGNKTVGVLVSGKDQIMFESGNANPMFKNYAAASHVEGKAALYMRQNNISSGTIYHNNPNGTCGYCNSMLPTLLPENSVLRVVPPSNAVANNSRAIAYPKTYIGNSNIPKVRR